MGPISKRSEEVFRAGHSRTGVALARRGSSHGTRLALLLMIGLMLALALGCQGGLSGRSASPTPEDAVHRIVESGRLRVGVSGVQPPLNMKNRSGALIGFDVDVAEALADAMDLELELIERPFGELLDGLERNEFDLVISSMTITPARNARVAFVGPYLISGATLLTREELLEELEDPAALAAPERRWGALAGSTGEALLREAFPSAKVVTTDDLSTLVPKVIAGELDGLVSDLPYVRFELARHPDSGLAELPSPLTTEPIGIALAPGSPLLANLVENYINALEYTGLLMQMKVYWLDGDDWLSDLPD
jgi:polar amino acid transport system substrate-binding protein